ncbi:GNAT family N-acetyltransferase [Anderseniella sp. Alg231-50]|uniref:GNAT family N-acetyltransferase n=1 Tax=Anderseniella sp. Alg231-50 TaxID=1922226 RepID=UPI000D552AE0
MATSAAPPPIELIEAGPEQAAEIDHLVAAFHQHEGVDVAARARRASIDSLLAMPAQGRILLVQTPDTVTVGYAVLAFGFSLEFGGRDAFLDELFIAEAFRGQGIGRAALAAVCAWARHEGLCALHLEVERDNTAAKTLYTETGFEDRSHYNLMSLHIANVRER